MPRGSIHVNVIIATVDDLLGQRFLLCYARHCISKRLPQGLIIGTFSTYGQRKVIQ